MVAEMRRLKGALAALPALSLAPRPSIVGQAARAPDGMVQFVAVLTKIAS